MENDRRLRGAEAGERPAVLRESAPKPRKASPCERTRAAVYATGNKWQIENFNATH